MPQSAAEFPLDAPRYTRVPFPAYRFLPGSDPHPTASSQGHSYIPPGHSEPPIRWQPPEEWAACEEYLYGCDLYNHGYWWEAHEAWEGLWRVCPKDSVQKRFLQGLIQVSACHLKLRLGRRDGVERLRGSSREHLKAALERLTSPPYMGLELFEFMQRVDRYYDALLAAPGRPEHDARCFPYIELS